MKFTRFTFMLLVLIVLGACSTPKVAYFQDNIPGQPLKVKNVLEIKVQPEDKISIIVNSKDPQLADLFNLPVITRQLGQPNSYSYPQGISGYTVSKEGFVDFPVLGEIKVSGRTRDEIEGYIKNELISRNLVKDPIVTVEFLNLYVSVLGEVKNPGRFKIEKDKLTLLDAISMAGDLTINGQRDRVYVQREVNGEHKIYNVNLTSVKDLYNSPVYFLQQNDVVYVEPNSKRAREATVNGNTVRSTSFWVSITSLLVSVAVLVVNAVK